MIKTKNTNILSVTVVLFAMKNSVIYLVDSIYKFVYDYSNITKYCGVIDINNVVIIE